MKKFLKEKIQKFLKTWLSTMRGRAWGKWIVDQMDRWDRGIGLVQDLEGLEYLRRVSPERRVMAGPFQGMIYPYWKSRGSSLFPKILGTYECELYPFLEECLRAGERRVIDLGCAEGYYAVGFALGNRGTRVLGVDIDPYALRSCEEMALVNRVHDQIEVTSNNDFEFLRGYFQQGADLVLCDAEGFEREYMNPSRWPELSDADIMVELHEFFSPGITLLLRERFQATHEIQVIQAQIPDHQKYASEHSISGDLSKRLLDEDRPMPMGWMTLVPKKRRLI